MLSTQPHGRGPRRWGLVSPEAAWGPANAMKGSPHGGALRQDSAPRPGSYFSLSQGQGRGGQTAGPERLIRPAVTSPEQAPLC